MSDEKHNDKTELKDSHLRENEEPREKSSPIPVFILFAFAALCFWGGIYLVEHSGGFNKNAYTEDYDPDAKVVAIQVSLFDRGKKIYNAQCVACHQTNGQGVPGVYPPLADSEWVLGHKEVLARILINGLNGPLEVRGNQYNGNMPAFGPTGLNLKSTDIASVLTYIRQEWGNNETDFTVATMEKYMDMYSARTTPWNAEELLQDLGPEPEPPAEDPVEEALDSEEASAETAALSTR